MRCITLVALVALAFTPTLVHTDSAQADVEQELLTATAAILEGGSKATVKTMNAMVAAFIENLEEWQRADVNTPEREKAFLALNLTTTSLFAIPAGTLLLTTSTGIVAGTVYPVAGNVVGGFMGFGVGLALSAVELAAIMAFWTVGNMIIDDVWPTQKTRERFAGIHESTAVQGLSSMVGPGSMAPSAGGRDRALSRIATAMMRIASTKKVSSSSLPARSLASLASDWTGSLFPDSGAMQRAWLSAMGLSEFTLAVDAAGKLTFTPGASLAAAGFSTQSATLPKTRTVFPAEPNDNDAYVLPWVVAETGFGPFTFQTGEPELLNDGGIRVSWQVGAGASIANLKITGYVAAPPPNANSNAHPTPLFNGALKLKSRLSGSITFGVASGGLSVADSEMGTPLFAMPSTSLAGTQGQNWGTGNAKNPFSDAVNDGSKSAKKFVTSSEAAFKQVFQDLNSKAAKAIERAIAAGGVSLPDAGVSLKDVIAIVSAGGRVGIKGRGSRYERLFDEGTIRAATARLKKHLR